MVNLTVVSAVDSFRSHPRFQERPRRVVLTAKNWSPKSATSPTLWLKLNAALDCQPRAFSRLPSKPAGVPRLRFAGSKTQAQRELHLTAFVGRIGDLAEVGAGYLHTGLGELGVIEEIDKLGAEL